MAAVTDEASPDYIPPESRIATFDMDGTLMGELFPTYLEVVLLVERILRDPSYQPDAEKYKNERSFYFDPDRSPLIVAHTEAELLDILSRPIDGPANCKAVLDFFGTHETGHASEAVARRIAEALDKVKS